MSLQAAIGHNLRGLEETTTRPCPAPSHPVARAPDPQVCEGCHTTGHHYTECLNHTYVWDSTANARLLAPGKCLSEPATWEDIHRASLHQLIQTTIQYYVHLHHTRIQDLDSLLTEQVTNSEFGNLTQFRTQGTTGISKPDIDLAEDLTAKTDPLPPPCIWEKRPGYIKISDSWDTSTRNPGIWLINLAVLAAATCLRVDPWTNTITGTTR